MYIATPEQPASYLFITRTSHLNHTRPQNAPHTTHKFRVLLLNARTQPSFDQTDDGVDAETSLSLSLSASLSLFSALTLFSHAHLWSLKLSLKMRVGSNELFSTLKCECQQCDATSVRKSATAVRMTTVRKRHCAVTCFTGKSPSSGIVKATFLPLCNPFPNHNLTEMPLPKP